MFNQILTIEISASAVSWYGAIVATLSVFISLLNYLRDRSGIKVKLSEGFVGDWGNWSNSENLQIFIEAINIGRRPVTLNGVGFSLKNGRQVIVTRPELINFPYELQEGKSIQTWVDKNDIFQDVARQKTKITYAWYQDATGKVYKTKFRIKND